VSYIAEQIKRRAPANRPCHCVPARSACASSEPCRPHNRWRFRVRGQAPLPWCVTSCTSCLQPPDRAWASHGVVDTTPATTRAGARPLRQEQAWRAHRRRPLGRSTAAPGALSRPVRSMPTDAFS